MLLQMQSVTHNNTIILIYGANTLMLLLYTHLVAATYIWADYEQI